MRQSPHAQKQPDTALDDATASGRSETRAATVEQLRTAAAARVEHTSLRGTAREIGMSPTGLKKFLSGTPPYSPTLRRILNWYNRGASRPTRPEDRITIDPAICHGKPTIRGLRYPVEMILELLSAGMSHEEILADYPDLEPEDILAVLEFAARLSRVKRIEEIAA